MPWTLKHYPPSMLRLSPPVRAKAIAIANALLEEGNEERGAIRMAIARAKLCKDENLLRATWKR